MTEAGNWRTTKYSTIGFATTLGWDNDECAKNYMRQLMSRGHAILFAHNWKLKHLKEFYPRSARLLGLNVNKGDEVCLRFRAPGAKNTFLPFQDVLCTFLHEIAHCKYSAHNKYFWRLYAQLVAECEQLELDATAASTLRALCSSPLCATSGRRLGGCKLTEHCNSPFVRRQLLADAAQRRLQGSLLDRSDGCAHDGVDASCGSSNNSDGHWICERCGNQNLSVFRVCDFCSDLAVDTEDKKDGWNCTRCTFHNYGRLQFCGACNFSSLTAVSEIGAGVQEIRPLAAWTEDLTVYTLLGRLADVLDPLLLVRRWQIVSLVEFTPLAQSVVSQGVFLNTTHLIVKVRICSPANASEFMPLAYVYAAVLHQLAHMIEQRHGVSFLEAWLLLLREFLNGERTEEELAIKSAVRESLLQFTAQLERLLDVCRSGLASKIEMSLFSLLFADCGNATKRERADESLDVGVKSEEPQRLQSFERWICTHCSFLNYVGTFLFCEVCGMSRSFCIFHGAQTMGLCKESAIIVEDGNCEVDDVARSEH